MKKLICKWFGHVKVFNFWKTHGMDVSTIYCQRCNCIVYDPYMSSFIKKQEATKTVTVVMGSILNAANNSENTAQ